MDKNKIMKWQSKLYDYIVYIVWFLYISIIIALFMKADNNKLKEYLNILEYYIKIYVSIFLVIRFRPAMFLHKKIHCNYLDKKIAFSAGIFLLTTSVLNNIYTYLLG